MVQIGQDDLLRALKGFKGLAKQDLLLTNDLDPQADTRRTHAEARRQVYLRLIELLETSGIEDACVFAYQEYLALPSGQEAETPLYLGQTQALEMFFTLIGVSSDQLRSSKGTHTNLDALLSSVVPPSGEAYYALS